MSEIKQTEEKPCKPIKEKEEPSLEEKEQCRKKLSSIVRHIRNVQEEGILLAERLVELGELDLARRLVQRCFRHDVSKFEGIEWEYLGSDNKERLTMAVCQHRVVNSHHPEFHIKGIHSMDDLDLAEFVVDVKARSSEFGTNLRDWIKDVAMERFHFKIQSNCYKKIKKYVDLLLDEPLSKV
jgi:hypothetical protein